MFSKIIFVLSVLLILSSAFTSPTVTDHAIRSSVLLLSEKENKDQSASSSSPTATTAVVRCPDCDLCDGSGRILGGIGVLIPAWPIKAYRPCPNFIARGGNYIRSGQSLDEIAFGGEKTSTGK